MKTQYNSLCGLVQSMCQSQKVNPLIKVQRKQKAETNFQPQNFLEQLNEKNQDLIHEYRTDIGRLTQLRLPGAKDIPEELWQIMCNCIQSASNLKELHLSQTNITPRQLQTLIASIQNHPNIETLEIFSASIKDDQCTCIAGFIQQAKNLEQIKLSDNHITATGAKIISFAIRQAIGAGARIKTFHIGGNDIGSAGVQQICKNLTGMISIQSLGLRNSSLDEASLNSVADLLAHPACGVQDLQLRKNNLTKIEYFCSKLMLNKSVRVLELQDTGLTVQQITLLGYSLSRNSCLHALNLSNNPFGDVTAQALAQIITGCEQLTTLSIDSCDLTSQSILIILNQIQVKKVSLAGISLQKNLINNAGFAALGQAVAAGQLTSLNVANNLITHDGMTQFCQLATSPNCRLRHLDLTGNVIGNIGAEALGRLLSGNQTILRVFVTDCSLGEQGANAILQGLQMNQNLICMAYGGQTKTQNLVSKPLRQLIDNKLKQNQQNQQQRQQIMGNNMPMPDLIEQPPGLFDFERQVKTHDELYMPFGSFGSTLSINGSINSSIAQFGQYDFDPRRVLSYQSFDQVVEKEKQKEVPFVFEDVKKEEKVQFQVQFQFKEKGSRFKLSEKNEDEK
ncbi:Conserved_hypothetical protein [Hexamita inflata]|uniref:Uncharacterized protein n=1 Tax=Hexamita inflata TaxID=28002 RepID=A0AA86QRD2_9EUKA|nr:Conserved hypothetical protein [Hexamita inflata]